MNRYSVSDDNEKEVFRIIPVLGRYYKWAESTISMGTGVDERRFAPVENIIYVGKLVKTETGGLRDGSWRRDTFRQHNGEEAMVNWSYLGNTCFIEVFDKTD